MLESGTPMTWNFPAVAALAIFVSTYILISLRRIPFKLDRPSAAMIGGTLMVLLGIVPFGDALHGAINWETIVLLLGMMIVVAALKVARFFEWVSTWILLRDRKSVVYG